MCNPFLNQDRSDAFAERMLDTVNSGALSLMISIGHRTRLFDCMAHLPPSTSAAIASAAELDERYVREWLGAMVTGRIVEFSAADRRYYLPREHAAYLTRCAKTDNMSAVAQFIGVLGQVEDQIVECFHHGGGVPYSEYPRFQDVMAEESANTVVGELVSSILPLVPGVLDRLEKGIDVIDIGCGKGQAINFLARCFPNSRFRGIDISVEGIAAATAEAHAHDLTNVEFDVRDATALEGDYDLITAFDAIHDQPHPSKVLDCVARHLRPEGVFLMQDIRASSNVNQNLDNPAAPLMYTISTMHCMTVSLSQGGEGLGAMWGEEVAQRMLENAGLTNVELCRLPHDFLNNYYIAKAS